MTSFGWKRKIGDQVSRGAVKQFISEAPSDEDEAVTSGRIDWITLAPPCKVLVLEDNITKSQRLVTEGTLLAEAERYWEALRKWDEALQMTPNNPKIYEMKAQAYISVGEVFPAVQAASKAVQLNSLWWPAHQTLGRAHLGLGEVTLAVKSFCRALHLNPVEREVWQEDLAWALELRDKQRQIQASRGHQCDHRDNFDTQDIVLREPAGGELGEWDSEESGENEPATFNSIPINYVLMRE